MGFFNWLVAKPAAKAAHSSQNDIHATLADATRPFSTSKAPFSGGVAGAVTAQPATNAAAQRLEQRRSERNARRELLFQVVRESMVRVGILSSAFKFKVLALDQRGRTFLVMIDLSAEFAGETEKLSEIEALIAQSAKTRFELVVQAVYWRFYEAVAVGAVRAAPASAPAPLFGMPSNSRPAPLSAQPLPHIPSVPPAPARAPATALADQRPRSNTGDSAEPLHDEEIEAFKRALASGSQPGMSIPLGGTTESAHAYLKTQPMGRQAVPPSPAIPAAVAKSASLAAIHNKLLLTGYEDTEMPDPDAPVLSATQYGELR
jgi:hypothetical protein